MSDKIISIPLNRQQLELLDRTVAAGHAQDRASLMQLAIREYLARHVRRDDAERPASEAGA